MTYTDLSKKLKFFEKSPHRLSEPHEGVTAYEYLRNIVWDWFQEQPKELFMTESWIEETQGVISRMSKLMKEV